MFHFVGEFAEAVQGLVSEVVAVVSERLAQYARCVVVLILLATATAVDNIFKQS